MILCKHCGLAEGAHHEYEALMPEGCQCDPGTWEGSLGVPICAELTWPKDDSHPPGYCMTCEHDMACHGKVDRCPSK